MSDLNSSFITDEIIFSESKKLLSTLNIEDLVKINANFLKKYYGIKCALILIIDKEKSLLLHRLYLNKSDFYVREFIPEDIVSNLLLKKNNNDTNNSIKEYILKSFPDLDLKKEELFKEFNSDVTNPIMFINKSDLILNNSLIDINITENKDISSNNNDNIFFKTNSLKDNNDELLKSNYLNDNNEYLKIDSSKNSINEILTLNSLKRDNFYIEKTEIFSKNAIFGVILSFYDSKISQNINSIEKIYIDFFAIALWNALEHHRILEINKQDYLTGLYNYKEFLNILKQEEDISLRYQTPFSVVFIDLDYFKEINDTYGHLTGTKVIIDVSQILRRDLRQYDCVTRYGGDEFVVLLKKTTKEQAFVVSYRLKHLIEEHVFRATDSTTTFHLTASFGIGTFPDDGKTVIDVISKADENMYYVKRNGKNGVKA